MSFGWSAGDIVAAIKLLQKVVVALKDSGGALSDYQDVSAFLKTLRTTLQHLSRLQSFPLDPELAQNLGELCEQIQLPVSRFCEEINSSFEQSLGVGNTTPKLLTIPRKVQWALSTSKKVKELRGKIGGALVAISIVLSQQAAQICFQIPSEVQARITPAIDSVIEKRIAPLTLAVLQGGAAIRAAQVASAKLIDQSRDNNGVVQSKLEAVISSQDTCAKRLIRAGEEQSQEVLEAIRNQTLENSTASVVIKEEIADLSTAQSNSTQLLTQKMLQITEGVQRQCFASRSQDSSLHQKLDMMTGLLALVRDGMNNLSTTKQWSDLNASNSDIGRAIEGILRNLWLLVSSLYILMQELVYLLAPYLIMLYRTRIQPLMICGDQFLFEDAVGRCKWLPCAQFQYWDTFYKLLVESFQGEAGLSWVLNGQFMVLNGFNEAPISQSTWRAAIQPKSKVAMAMILKLTIATKGRYTDPSCSGWAELTAKGTSQECPVFKTQLFILNNTHLKNTNLPSKSTSLDQLQIEAIGSGHKTSTSLELNIKGQYFENTPKKIALFKRLWLYKS